MVHFCFSSFSLEILESAHSFPAQRVVIEPTRRTAAVLSLRAIYPCSSHERNCKSDRTFLSIMLRGRNRAPLLLRSLDIENYEGCFEISERIYLSRNWEVLVETFCFSQRQNLLQVNARTEGYWHVSLRSWRYCLGARLKFRRRSCDLKKGVERGVWISISRGLRRQISLDYCTRTPAAQAAGRWNNQIWCRLEAAVS